MGALKGGVGLCVVGRPTDRTAARARSIDVIFKSRECATPRVCVTRVVSMAKIEEMSSSGGDASGTTTSSGAAADATTTGATTTTEAVTKAPETPALKMKMFIAPVLLLGGKRLGIDYKDAQTITNIRMCFVTSMTLLIGLFSIVYFRLQAAKKRLEEDKVRVKSKDLATGETKEEEVTLYEHDFREFKKVLSSNLMGAAMVSLMHSYMKVVPPLLLQSIMMPLNLSETQLFQVHVLGRTSATHANLKRPWEPEPVKSPFAAFTEGFNIVPHGELPEPVAPGQGKKAQKRASGNPKKAK